LEQKASMADEPDVVDLLRDLIDIDIALTTERSLPVLLGRILAEARRITRAEAGTLFLREGDRLRFAMTQNDVLAARLSPGELETRFRDGWLPVDGSSLAGWAAMRNEVLNVDDAYALSADSPYAFHASFDDRTVYRTRSVMVVPLQDPGARVIGVLELINALDDKGRAVPFHRGWEPFVRALASVAAAALNNVQLEQMSYKDPLTGIYNRRYFALRLDEELQRQVRSGQPLSLLLIDIDHFKAINDTRGLGAGDDTLRELAAALLDEPPRGFSVTSRYDDDEFAVLLTDTTKSGALGYARRLQAAMGRRDFPSGRVTLSMGVATLPDDAAGGQDLLRAADRALYQAKRTSFGVASARP
jgi:diguanylate cyclase (GGDEF)-like protein